MKNNFNVYEIILKSHSEFDVGVVVGACIEYSMLKSN